MNKACFAMLMQRPARAVAAAVLRAFSGRSRWWLGEAGACRSSTDIGRRADRQAPASPRSVE